jgi:purine-binding chemotaxis protein CheW
MSETKTIMQYLTFTLSPEIYALEVGNVREVLEMPVITPIPRSPDFMRGVINIRGSVVPVVDLRLKLGMSRTEKAADTCVVVLDAPIDGQPVTIGAMVDSVQEVVDFDSDRIQPPPRMRSAGGSELLKGIGGKENRFIMILDIEKVFADGELARMASATEAAKALTV